MTSIFQRESLCETPADVVHNHDSAVEVELQDVPLNAPSLFEHEPLNFNPLTSPSSVSRYPGHPFLSKGSHYSWTEFRPRAMRTASTPSKAQSDAIRELYNKSDINLPCVEDGLSSGSDTENIYGTLDTSPSDKTGESRSHAPTSLKPPHLNSNSPDCPRESLVNPPVVQDIWGIMNELKQTLTDDGANLRKQTDPPSHRSGVASECFCRTSDSVSSDITGTYSKQISCVKERGHSSALSRSGFSTLPSSGATCNTSSDKGNCSKLVVQANVEHTTEASLDSGYLPNSKPSVTRTTDTDRAYPDFRSPATEKSSRQWTFQVHSNTVYSSSEDELATSMTGVNRNRIDVGRQRTLREVASSTAFSNPVSKVSTVASINTSSTESVSSGRRRSSLPKETTARDTSSASAFRNTYMEDAKRCEEFDSDADTDQLLERQYQADKSVYIPELKHEANAQAGRQSRMRKVSIRHPDFPDSLINGVLFRARYLGSTQLISERQPTRNSRMFQAQEAVARVKAPDGESQPSVPVEFFVSVDRLLLLNPSLQDVLIDHELRTVSYVADIGDLFILMARRQQHKDPNIDAANHSNAEHSTHSNRPTEIEHSVSSSDTASSDDFNENKGVHTVGDLAKKTFAHSHQSPTKFICHVLESQEARLIAQSVGHAFQLAYLDFLRENGVEDLSSVKHLNYQDVANQQEIFCDELTLFSDKERHKQITIPKQCGEPLGVVIVSSGWGSLLPTALLANMNPVGPACRSGQLNIGNHIISVNGQSLVGLPLEKCQRIIKACRKDSSVKLVVVDCPPVVEVLIRRPNAHCQLGFSVQDGMICSLLRGGIAERGGIRVDHRIIEINGQSVVAVSHEKIVQLLASSVGEIHIRTMPTSVFRLLTGQETPCYI